MNKFGDNALIRGVAAGLKLATLPRLADVHGLRLELALKQRAGKRD